MKKPKKRKIFFLLVSLSLGILTRIRLVNASKLADPVLDSMCSTVFIFIRIIKELDEIPVAVLIRKLFKKISNLIWFLS